MLTRLAPEEDWLVCLHATRVVVDGRVACPLRGWLSVNSCAACHLLAWRHDERDERAECGFDTAGGSTEP